MNMELPEKRKRVQPQRRCMDVVREDMGVLGLIVEDVNESGKWKKTICGGDP